MSDMIFRPLIQDMTWSYSRVKCFDDCPYRFFLKYIRGCDDMGMFYASYGSFMHKLLEGFYNGNLSKQQMLMEFLLKFGTEVCGRRPQSSTVRGYIDSGIKYLTEFKPLPFHMLGVEKRVTFLLNGIPFTGILDYIGESNGELYLVDHKSRKLSRRSTRQNPTKKDMELDDMLKQLYIYSIAVEEMYGRQPDYLCFNCFRTGELIKEPFDTDAFDAAKEWAVSSILRIQNEDEFEPEENIFVCSWICGVHHKCKYYLGNERM